MPSRPLDLEVVHRGRHEATFQATGDPSNHPWLENELRGWLRANRWHSARWNEFEMRVRNAGEGKIQAVVRP